MKFKNFVSKKKFVTPDFENAITKIQYCKLGTLSEEEKEQLSNLKYPEPKETQNPENESDFAASIMKKRKIATGVSRSQT